MISIEIIKYLGDKLGEKINISPSAARGMLKLAIKDQVGPFKPLSQLNYSNLKLILQNALRERLEKLEIPHYESVIEFLTDELTQNQSLITMAGV